MFAQINTPAIVSDIIDGEAVILNLLTGNYYSLEGAGAEIWDLLVRGLAISEVAETLAGRYGLSIGEIEPAIQGLMSELEAEELVSQVEVLDRDANSAFIMSDVAKPNPGLVFETPKLVKYTDLQDLLLLDPIHEVGPDGWPIAIQKQ
jgi:hypothetical protein